MIVGVHREKASENDSGEVKFNLTAAAKSIDSQTANELSQRIDLCGLKGNQVLCGSGPFKQ